MTAPLDAARAVAGAVAAIAPDDLDAARIAVDIRCRCACDCHAPARECYGAIDPERGDCANGCRGTATTDYGRPLLPCDPFLRAGSVG